MKDELPEFPHTVSKNGVTAKIYHHTNKGYAEFKLSYYHAEQRKLETFADFRTAQKRAEEVVKGIAHGDHAVLTLRADERATYERAIKALKPSNTPLDVAAERYAVAIAKLGTVPLLDAVQLYVKRYPQNMPTKSVTEAVSSMIKAKQADGASAIYIRDMDLRLGEFAEAFQCAIASVDAPVLNAWLRNLKCSGRTRNNYRALISTLFRYAEAQGWLPKDHIDFDQVAKARENQTEIEIFTPVEMMKLLNAAQLNPENLGLGYNRRYATRQGLLPLLVLGGFAGMRTAEIQRQLWTDVNLERGYIRVTSVKGNTAAKRLVPITDNLRAWLAVCRRDAVTCCDYPRSNEAIQRLAERAGVPWRHNGLRHSYCSYRVAEVQNVHQVALECGNSTGMIFKHYREIVSKEDAKTWFSIMPQRPDNVVQLPAAQTS